MLRILAWPSQTFVQASFTVRPDDVARKLQDEYLQFHRIVGMNGGARAFLKSRLGKQDYTWVGSVRNWIWEGRDGVKWRAFASKRGFSFEISDTADSEETEQAWKDFLRRVQVTL